MSFGAVHTYIAHISEYPSPGQLCKNGKLHPIDNITLLLTVATDAYH